MATFLVVLGVIVGVVVAVVLPRALLRKLEGDDNWRGEG